MTNIGKLGLIYEGRRLGGEILECLTLERGEGKMKFVFVAVSVPALRQVREFERRYRERWPAGELAVKCFYVAGREARYLLEPGKLQEAVRTADVVVIDTMGASEKLQETVRVALERCEGERIVIGNTLREYLRLGSFSMAAMRKSRKKKEAKTEGGQKQKGNALDKMHKMRRMALMLGNVLPFGVTRDMKNVFLLIDYWQQATQEDIFSFFYLLLRQYGKQKFLPKEKPCTMEYGIYLKDPDTLECCPGVTEYWEKRKFQKEKDTVALLFYGHSYPNDFLPVVRAIMRELEGRYNILPVAFSQNEDGDLEKLEEIVCQNISPVAAVINLMPFRLGAGPMGGDAKRAVEILDRADVPYLKPFCLTKVTQDEWKNSAGVNPGEFLISILLPELDGGILSMPAGVMGETEDGELPQLIPEKERIHTLGKRLDGLVNLQKKRNAEKQVAIIFYNYPPGESNVFGGAFLDTFASASGLLQQLKKASYQTEEMSPEKLREAFVTGGNCNCPEWYDENEKKIKGIVNGNVFLGLQPVRREDTGRQESAEDYHDRNRKPTEEYQEFYRWIREDFGADAVLHFGTHGTLEFLPGKETGVTGACWPDRLVGAVPHFYYYYIGNPSEAMVAKRRSLATLISYQAPPLKKSGLYETYQELKETIAEYRESQQSAPERCEDLLEQIGKLAAACEGIPVSQDGLTAGELDAVEEQLYTYENSLITDGLHCLNEEESRGILHALDGKYLPAGTAGDVKKNPEILPSGRNLVQFDPRLIPTRTAWERGEKAAKLTVERYYKKTGKYPDTTAVILWGLETSRSQGETIGQILYYLGFRLKTEKASYDDRLEVIPMEELGRPRMDVVIHICGFFRDMYPNLIDNLNEMLQQLLGQGESEEENYFLKNTRKLAKELRRKREKNHQPVDEKEILDQASCRIFGPKNGAYGTNLTDIVRKGNWKEAAQLGEAFVSDLSFGYSYRRKGLEGRDLLEKQYTGVQMISQVRNNVEYELTDLDHYYEFYGGLAKAVENEKGEKPVMLVADTVGDEVKVQDIRTAVEQGIVTRLLNPRWIEGMMRHEYHGVQQIEKRFENVMGFASTTDAVQSDTFSRLTACYAGDEKLRHRMQESNRWAYLKMMERLMEARNRGYYQASEEELAQIQEAYLEAEGEAEE